jgi:hypothetical protein
LYDFEDGLVHLQPWWDKTCGQKILGYEYRNSPFHFAAVNLNFGGENMLCERESAKACWKISFQPLKIPLKDKKMGIFGWSSEKAP